jgi:predicted methyltransferase MtxX (methanogen marker protein 4)
MTDCKIFTIESKNDIISYIDNLLNKKVDLIVKGELFASGTLSKFRKTSYVIIDSNNSKFKFDPNYLINDVDAVKKNILAKAE